MRGLYLLHLRKEWPLLLFPAAVIYGLLLPVQSQILSQPSVSTEELMRICGDSQRYLLLFAVWNMYSPASEPGAEGSNGWKPSGRPDKVGDSVPGLLSARSVPVPALAIPGNCAGGIWPGGCASSPADHRDGIADCFFHAASAVGPGRNGCGCGLAFVQLRGASHAGCAAHGPGGDSGGCLGKELVSVQIFVHHFFSGGRKLSGKTKGRALTAEEGRV